MSTLPQLNHDPHEQGQRILTAALELAAAGVRVFPVWGLQPVQMELSGEPVTELRCACGTPHCDNAGKHPVGRLAPHGHNDADTALDTVHQWFGVPAAATGGGRGGWVPHNLGVATGRGLVVVDAESRATRNDLPTGLEVLDDWESWTEGTSLPVGGKLVRTGSGGVHLWLRVPAELRVSARNRVLPGVDVKGDGGYVLAPPSAHASGGFYVLERDAEWGECSGALVAWLLSAKGGRYVSRKARDGTASVPDDYDFQRIIHGDGCPAGHRDYFVNDLCFRLRRAGAQREEAAQALRREWLRMEHPPGQEFTWEACAYKLRRVWEEVQPEDVTDLPVWRPARSELAASGEAGAPEALNGQLEPGAPLVAGGATTAELLARPELTLHLSDSGNGMRFAQRMREVVRHCVGEGRWYLWDGSRWAPDELNQALRLTEEIIKDLYVEASRAEGNARDRVENWARQTESLARRRAMLDVAGAQPEVAIKPDYLDADPHALVVRNGTLDLRAGTLRASLPEDLNTRRADAVFDPAAECPLWRQHIEFVTGGDASLAAWLQRAVGYTLTGLTDEQKLFFLWGNGANGKSTFVDVVAHVLGDYATQADGNLLAGAGDHPTQLAGLRGARLVVADETEQGRKLREQRVKAITGGKRIRARFMRQDYFEFTPRFKLWITGNHKPEIAGTDHGIWRRLRLVPFTGTLTDDTRVLGFDELLLREASGILNWALAGLRDWLHVGGLGEPELVRRATSEYRDEEDTLGQWIADECLEDYAVGLNDGWKERGAWDEASALFASWSQWAVTHGHEAGNTTRFGRTLSARGAQADQISVGGRKLRVRRGIWRVKRPERIWET